MAWLPGDNHGAAAAFAVGVVLCYLLPVPAACRGGLGIGLSACYLSILIATDRPDAPVNILVDTAVGFGLANLVGAVVGRWVAAVRRRQFAVTHALERAADELQTFRGLLPICACCKSIRDDHGHWQRLEKYIQARTPATFTHGICPPCLASEYGVTPDGSKLPTLAGK